jgi:dihydroneopterin aldolase
MNNPLAFEVRQHTKNIVIGCSQKERASGPQEVLFDVLAHVPCEPKFLIDTWNPVFDYCDLRDSVDEACEASGDKILQEPLALDVISRVFNKTPEVIFVEVFIQKTARYKGTKSIGFRIGLSRIQWSYLIESIGKVQKVASPQ